MTNQPKWECVAQLGDVDPVEYGGYWILRDTTGVYPEEAEVLPETSEKKRQIFRFILEKCTYQNGILSDNKFHPEHEVWFAKYLEQIAESTDYPVEQLIQDFCDDDCLKRAMAYRAVYDYHGLHEFDWSPIQLSKSECRKRYKKKMYREQNANRTR
jgi:hypothetical protein